MIYILLIASANSGTAARSVVAAGDGIKKVGDFRVLSGFDSLNARFHSNWPFGPSYAVAVDPARGYVFMGSGGGVLVLDSNLAKVGEIRTRGIVWGLHYDEEGEDLYIAAGKGGLEIWDVSTPNSPLRLSITHNSGEFRDVYVTPSRFSSGNKFAYIAAGYGGVHVYVINDPYSPTYVGTYNIGGSGYALKVLKHEDKIYVAAGDSGLIILKDNAPSNAAPTHIKSINNGYTYALAYGDLYLRGQLAGTFNSPSPDIFFLFYDGSYNLAMMNVKTQTVEYGKILPSGMVPKDVLVFSGYVWLLDGSRTDSSLVRYDSYLNSYIRAQTWGPGVSMAASGRYVYVAASNYGVSKIEVLRDTLDHMLSFVPFGYSSCGGDVARVRRVNGSFHAVSTGGSYAITDLYSLNEVCFSGYDAYGMVMAIGRYKYSVVAFINSTSTDADSVYVVDTATMTVVSQAPTRGKVVRFRDIIVIHDTVYVAYWSQDSSTSYLGVYSLSPTGNISLARTITLDTSSGPPYMRLRSFGDYLILMMGNIGIRVYDTRGGLTPVATISETDMCNSIYTSTRGISVGDMAYRDNRLYTTYKCWNSYPSSDTMVLAVWDFSTPSQPYLLSINRLPHSERWVYSGPQYMHIFGDRLALTIYTSEFGDSTYLYIYDISDPVNPRMIVSDRLEGAPSGDIIFENDTLFVPYGRDIAYYDVNARTSPRLVSFYTAWGWTKDLEVYGNYAYLAIEDGNDAALFGGQDLVILDISGTQPTYVSGITLTGEAEGLTVANDTVYMAMGENGVYAIDVTNKTSPSLVNSYNTPGYAYDVYCDCALFGSGLLFIADSSSLYAIDHSSFTYHEDYGTSPGVAVGVATSGGVAYVAMKGGIDGGLLAVDVSSTPFTYLGKYTDSYVLTDAMDVSLDMFNNLAYVAYMDNGMDAIDISDPTAMSLQGYWYEFGNKVIGTHYDATGGKVYIANYYDGFVGSAYDPIGGTYYTTSRYTTPSGPRDVWYRDGKVYTASVTAGMQVYTADVATAREERPGKVDGIEVAFGEGGKVMLRGEGEGIEVKIYDASGRLMYSKRVDVRGEEVLRTGLPSGVFMLRLKEGSRSRLLKFVVR